MNNQQIDPKMAQAMQQEAMMKMIKNAKPILCKCGCTIFKEAIQVVKSSSMDPNNPSGRDQLIHVPVLYCIKCLLPVDVM